MIQRYLPLILLLTSAALLSLLFSGCAGKKTPEIAEAPVQPRELPTRPSVSATAQLRPASQISTDGIWYNSVPVNGPFIAITFDDGPHATNTPRLLDILAQRNVKATFFVVGQNVVTQPGILRRMAAEGHEIGNHTWNHPSLTSLSLDNVHSQFQRTHDAIVEATGVRPRTMRPPYGAFNKSLAANTFEKFGYKTIMWSVDPRDWKDRSAGIVTSRILSGTRSGSIILAHDIHKSTIDAMPETLDKLLAAGYKFVTVSQLIGMEHRGPLAIYQSDEGTGHLSKLAPNYLPTLQPFGATYRAPNQMPYLQYSYETASPRYLRVAY